MIMGPDFETEYGDQLGGLLVLSIAGEFAGYEALYTCFYGGVDELDFLAKSSGTES